MTASTAGLGLETSASWRSRATSSRRLADAAIVLAVLAVAVGAIVARRPTSVLHPELWAEDGTFWFANAYNEGPWSPLLQPHTGYLQTFPRLVSDAGLLVPLRVLPLLFAVTAIAVQALPAVVVASRRFAPVIPGRPARLLLVGLYLALPNSTEIDANLTNAQWHLALLALVCLLAAPGGPGWKVLDVAATVLSGLTGPFVLVLAVVGAWWVWKGPRPRWTLVLWATSVVLAAVQGAELLTSPRGQLAALGVTLHRLLRIVGGQIGLGSLVGQSSVLSTLAGPRAITLSAVAFALFVVVVGWALLRGPLALRVFLVYALVVLASSLESPVASLTIPQWQALSEASGVRYWFFPTLAFLVSAGWLALRPLEGWLAARRGGRARPSRRRRLARLAPVALGAIVGLGVVGVAAGNAMPSDWTYPSYPAVGYARAVAAFARAPRGQRVDIPIDPPGWEMALVKH